LKVVNIKSKKSALDNKIACFRKNRKFSDFLDIVEYCLSNQMYDCAELLAEWEAGKGKIQAGDHFEVFTALLPKFSVYYLGNSPEFTRKFGELNKDVVSLIAKASSSFGEYFEVIDSYQEKYSWFLPAICLADQLEAVYPDELNPGKVVAIYLKTLFPGKLPSDIEIFSADYTYCPEYKLPFNSSLYCLVRLVGEWALNQSVFDPELKQCMETCFCDYLDPENYEERFFKCEEPLLFLANLLNSPRDLYYCWVTECLFNLDSPWLSSQELLNATLMCFPVGRGNSPLILDQNYNHLFDESVINKFKAGLLDLQTLNDSRFLSYDSFLRLVYRGFDAVYHVDHECFELLKILVTRFGEYRREYLAGCAPFHAEAHDSEAVSLVEAIGLDNIDLSLLLVNGMNHYGCLSIVDDEKNSYFDRASFFNYKQHAYLAAFRKSVAEGLNELGVALLSLYIFSRGLIMKGRFGQLPDLLTAVERALTLPGSKIIKHTIAFVVEATEEYFRDDPLAMASALHFRNLLPQQAELHVLPGGRKEGIGRQWREQEIWEFFEGNLGPARWGKISENSRACLVSAELQWRNSAVEFGFGIKDWSGLVTTYCKPLEGELLDHLGKFYLSDAYAGYLEDRKLKRPAKPTAGWLLKELKSYSSMPEPVQEAINKTGVKLHEDMRLVNALYDLFQNYRNIAAHPDAVSMSRFAEFKRKLFQERVLHLFIDAVCC